MFHKRHIILAVGLCVVAFSVFALSITVCNRSDYSLNGSIVAPGVHEGFTLSQHGQKTISEPMPFVVNLKTASGGLYSITLSHDDFFGWSCGQGMLGCQIQGNTALISNPGH